MLSRVYRLLRAARAAERHDGTKQFTDLVEVIKEDHIRAGRETIKSPEILDAFIDQVTAECKSLHQILQSAHHLEEVSVKVNDKIISKVRGRSKISPLELGMRMLTSIGREIVVSLHDRALEGSWSGRAVRGPV